MNLAIIDTKINEVKVFNESRKLLGRAQFNISLEPEQVEAMRLDPIGFLSGVKRDIDDYVPESA